MSFLSNKQAEPLSGEATSFVNDNGFIGELMATRLHEMSSLMDPAEAGLSVMPVTVEEHGEYYWMWFSEKDHAVAAKDTLAAEYGSREVWRYVMRTDSIQNVAPESLAKFTRDFQTGSSRTSMHHRYRHQLHLLSLVGAVAAHAKLLGYDVPKVQFDDLVSSDTQFTDELMNHLIGDPAVKASEADDPLHYLNSIYGKQRAAVWAALGESDPSKYNAVYDTKGNPTKEAPNVTFTQSEDLARALSIAHFNWSSSTWARLLFVEDPHVDAKHDDDFPDRVPVIMELFASKADAVAAGKAELAKRAAQSSDSDNGIVSGVPTEWDADQWAEEMTEITAMLKGIKGKSAKRKKIAEYINAEYGSEADFAATAEDVLASL